MEAFLVVIAFCVNNQCAFFVSDALFASQPKCEAMAVTYEEQLVKRFGPQTSTLMSCVKVPMKIS
jgi:hypothetical protein